LGALIAVNFGSEGKSDREKFDNRMALVQELTRPSGVSR